MKTVKISSILISLIDHIYTNEVNNATYFTVILFSLLLLVKKRKRKRAPTAGNSIKEERIGKFII